jgi:protein-S-isoprenylcysteine O-methyltransferase Ste14
MERKELRALHRKIAFVAVAAVIVIGVVMFVPAGTLDYWQAWMYNAVLLVSVGLVGAYFLKNDPEFIERRLRTKEKEAAQGLITKIGDVVFTLAFLIPGFDRRFGWSAVPMEYSLIAEAVFLLGYLIVFLSFRENSYAGRTVEVVRGQKVISSGPYSIIRHPMYLGSIILYLATPIALGSYMAIPGFLLVVPIMVFRIISEEEFLKANLQGYGPYLRQVKYRLVPFVW